MVRMTLTKNDMARVVIQALYNLDELPTADDSRVVRMTRHRKKPLRHQYDLAMCVLQQKIDRMCA